MPKMGKRPVKADTSAQTTLPLKKKPATKKLARKPVKKKVATAPSAEKPTPKVSTPTPKAPPLPPVPKEPISVAKPFEPMLLFTDLHLNGDRLEDALSVLDRVWELAEQHNATPVCCGDFWHLRGHYLVRHVEEVLRRLETWQRGVFIPGNHDQVSVDGSIHGLNFLRALDRLVVATEPVLHLDTRVAYLPWRENHDQQRAQLAALEGDGWTICAHAEVGGAVANSGHKTPGIIQVADIEAKARACYLGHYHKRQKLGDRTWYLGNPYQQNMGEREWPHGVALVTADTPEPAFIELEGYRRYWRLDVSDGSWDAKDISKGDVVELQVPVEMIGTEEHHAIAEKFATDDVRVIPQKTDRPGDGAPAFALTLDAAIEAWAQERFVEEFQESGVATAEELALAGRELLGRLPDARAIPPLGSKVRLLSIRTKDFCALNGELSISVGEYSRLLMIAPVATGKTAVLDAPMWCLYGETSPRKAGQSGASIRADGVINDNATECSVECVFEVADKQITIRREKKRGSGAKVHIEGVDYPEGISDQDQLIRHVVGLDHTLWRACVSMGQGAVANFATDADKRRKELLSSAFDLKPCEVAVKFAKKERDDAKQKAEMQYRSLLELRATKATLKEQDFSKQAEIWEQQHTTTLESLRSQYDQAQATVTQCDQHLQGEAEWKKHRASHQDYLDRLTGQLTKVQPDARVGELQRQYGAIEAEVAQAQRELNIANQQYQSLMQGGASPPCPQCGQLLPPTTMEQHFQAAEGKVRGIQEQLKTLQHRQANLAQELHSLNEGDSAERQGIEAQLAGSREALAQCDRAMEQFSQIRNNREVAVARMQDLTARLTEESGAQNPFRAKMDEMAREMASLDQQISTVNQAFETAQGVEAVYSAWVTGFGPKGIPAMVLRTALHDLEQLANRYLADLLDGMLYCQLRMDGDDLKIVYYETKDQVTRERAYEQLSGGQRRCVEMALSPLALSEMIFSRVGVRVSLLMVDELTTHMGAREKLRAAEVLERLDRDTILVVDHDVSVQGHFDKKMRLESGSEMRLVEA